MTLWYNCGNGWLKTRGLARSSLGVDAYVCCPGPSLARVNTSALNGPGRMVFAVTTAYPAVRPDVWIGTDVPECYDRRVWAEPFIKVVRGSYADHSCQGRPLHEFPNVVFADLEDAQVLEMLDRRSHDTAFLWNRNTFTTALHLVIWMGARRIFLVGCDFGGSGDYHDGRKLPDERRKDNRRLYANLVKDLRVLAPAAKARGIEIVSTTPDSPVNKFLPYLALADALRSSESEAPDRHAPLLHAADAELCQWGSNPPHDRGVMVGVGGEQEHLLPHWFDGFQGCNKLPLAFADLGMSAPWRRWCEERGQVVDVTDVHVARACFRRPFAILRAPFKEVLFVEPVWGMRGPVEAVFQRCLNGNIGCARDGNAKDTPACDSSVVLVRHGHSLVTDWATECLAREDRYDSDGAALASVAARCGYEVDLLPEDLVCGGRNGDGANAAALVRMSPEDQDALKGSRQVASGAAVPVTQPGSLRWASEPTEPLGVMVPVCDGQEDLVAWWWWAYARHNRWPVAFCDFGMNEGTRHWCEARGRVIPHGAPAGIDGWFRKPFVLLKSPFRQTVWSDLDCEIRADVSTLAAFSNGRLALGRDWSYPVVLQKYLPFEGTCWSSALAIVPHGDPLVVEWAAKVVACWRAFRGDQEILSALLSDGRGRDFAQIPIEVLHSRQEGETDGAAAVHWSGPGGKGAIRRAWAAIEAGACRDMRSAFWRDWACAVPTADRGIVIGVDQPQEWILDWWWSNCSRHNDLPVHFVDFGLSAQGRDWCARRGTLSGPLTLGCYGWFKKPLAFLESPFKEALWLDNDCEVRGPLSPLFEYCGNGTIGLTLDRGTPEEYREAMPADTPIYNSGAVVFGHGDPVVPQWASMTLALMSEQAGDARFGQPGDQETLALALRRFAQGRLREMPRELVRLRVSDGDGAALVMHWTGPVGKAHIREAMARKVNAAVSR